jgi:hypothetical protein
MLVLIGEKRLLLRGLLVAIPIEGGKGEVRGSYLALGVALLEALVRVHLL